MAAPRRPRKPKPVPADDIERLIEETATETPETPPAPPTILDAVFEFAFFIKQLSKQAQIPLGTAVTIAQLRMNYEISMRQLNQQTPPWLNQIQQAAPADEASQETE